MSDTPAWRFDPNDERLYPLASGGRCPADGMALRGDPPFCGACRRVFSKATGERIAHTWATGAAVAPRTAELLQLLVMMLRSAMPHPVEHPTMWKVWGHVCERLDLNPSDYRIPRSP